MIISISGKKSSGKDTVGKMIQYIAEVSEVDIEYSLNNNTLLQDINEEPSEKTPWKIKKWATKVKQVAALILVIDPKRFEDESFKSQKMDERWIRYRAFGELFGSKEDLFREHPDFKKEMGYKEVESLKEIPTYREFLQEIGTDAFRDMIHPDTWVNGLMAEYKPINWKSGTDIPIYPNWLITDTRFPNEVEGADSAPDQTFHLRVERKTELRLPNLWNEFQGSQFEDWEDFLKARGKYKDVYHRSETALDNKEDWDYVINNNGSLEDLFDTVKHLKEEVLDL